MMTTSYTQLSNEDRALIDAAEGALQNAYNPYNSQVKVAAAVRTSSGEIITGASYVNASSPSSICAERSAIITANSLGKREILAMAVIGAKAGGIRDPVTPCGNFRQAMQEVTNITGRDLMVLCANSDKSRIMKTSLSELLPFPYGGNWKK